MVLATFEHKVPVWVLCFLAPVLGLPNTRPDVKPNTSLLPLALKPVLFSEMETWLVTSRWWAPWTAPYRLPVRQPFTYPQDSPSYL